MRDYYKEAYQKTKEEELRNKSLQGRATTREQKTITIDKKAYHARLRAVAIITAIATGTIISAANPVINKLQDDKIVKSLSQDFKTDCLDQATDRVYDANQHYIDVANYITNDFYDFDIGMYLLEDNTNEYELDEVLQRTNFGSLENYLQSINYTNTKDWEKDMRKRIAQDDEIYQDKIELSEMISGHRNEQYGLEDRAGLLH